MGEAMKWQAIEARAVLSGTSLNFLAGDALRHRRAPHLNRFGQSCRHSLQRRWFWQRRHSDYCFRQFNCLHHWLFALARIVRYFCHTDFLSGQNRRFALLARSGNSISTVSY